MPQTIEVNDSNFDELVKQSDVPVMVDFWAEWCGPCKVIAPILEELADEYDGKVKIAKLDAEENTNTATGFNVTSLPTQVFFKDGEDVDRASGAVSKSDLKKKLDCLL